MVVIPHHLMLSVFHARGDPDTGHVYREKAPLLKSDNGLAIYIMQEMLKGESSFYWPYLRILPVPSNLRHWSESDLLELQETRIARWAATRTRQLRMLYRDTMEVLSNSYPRLFPVSGAVTRSDGRAFEFLRQFTCLKEKTAVCCTVYRS